MGENSENIRPVSYKKCLPTLEGSPDDTLSYIDLQYNPKGFKLPHSSSQSKFNSLPNIKSRRRSHYISSLEGSIFPKSDRLDNLTMEVNAKDTESKTVEPTKDEDTESKTSESTTVVISTSDSVCSDSPRGIANEAFEDDEEVDSSCKKGHRRSPSGSLVKEKNCDVSYSSSGSSIEIPVVLTKEEMKKKEMSKEYQYIVPDTKLKKGWRGEKLYFAKGNADNRADRHFRRFCWWMVCLALLAGAITVAGLIGVGVIKLPLHTENERIHNYSSGEQAGPRIGQVRNQDAPQETTAKSLIEMISPPRMKEEEVRVPYVPKHIMQSEMTTVQTEQPKQTTQAYQGSTKTQTTTESIWGIILQKAREIPVMIMSETTPDLNVTPTPTEITQTTMDQQPTNQQEQTERTTMTKQLSTQPEQIQVSSSETPLSQTIAPVTMTTTQAEQTDAEEPSTETTDKIQVVQNKQTTQVATTEMTTVQEELSTEPTTIFTETTQKSIFVEVQTEELVEGSGNSDDLVEVEGSGNSDELVEINTEEIEPILAIRSSNDKIKTISVEELFQEEFEASGDFPASGSIEQLELNTEFVMTREIPENNEDGEMELVITLPEMLSGSFLDIMESDSQDGSGDNSFELNQLAESVKNSDDVSESFDNGEDVFKALLDLILPKKLENIDENIPKETEDSGSLGELIKFIGSQ